MQSLAVIALATLVLGGCSGFDAEAPADPVVVGVDSGDKDVAELIAALLQSVHTVPDSGTIRGRLGMAYDINGYREAAIATYRQAESLNPRDFRWPYFSAQLVSEGGDYEGALDLLDRALAIDAAYAPAWLWRGSWLLKSNRPAEARDAYRQAADLDETPHAIFGQARALMAAGEYPEAVEILERLTDLLAHPYVRRTYGEALRAVGRLEDARNEMSQGREAESLVWSDERRDQRYAHIRGHASYMLAKELSAAGRLGEALAILRRLQTHHPEEQCGRDEEFYLACNLMNSVGIAQDRAGRREQALATVERGLALNSAFAPFHLTIANLLRQARDLETALVHVDRAIGLSPSSGYAHEQRGRLLFGLDRHEDARAAFESALQFEPGKRTTLFYLGLAEFELSNHPEAVAWFQRAIDVEPNFALGHLFLARSLVEIGRIDEARHAQDLARQYGADAAELRRNEIRLRELEASGDGSG